MNETMSWIEKFKPFVNEVFLSSTRLRFFLAMVGISCGAEKCCLICSFKCKNKLAGRVTLQTYRY